MTAKLVAVAYHLAERDHENELIKLINFACRCVDTTQSVIQSRHAKVQQSRAFLISFAHVRAKIGPMASQVAPHVLQLLTGPWGLFRSGW